ncbi:MAG: hypothetical protein JNM27_04445, partial [Leptospirales bacterium]|nr:hypothetical protein [Leptospirales bacterium]
MTTFIWEILRSVARSEPHIQSGTMSASILQNFNLSRFEPGQKQGHYESYFQRANHPTLPHAFWIRYTIFSPQNAPEKAIGELWAIYFDGTTSKHIAVKAEFPIAQCSFDRNTFNVRIANSLLSNGSLKGQAANGNGSIAWDLTFTPGQEPLFDFPVSMYETGLPKAKVLVGHPLAKYSGTLTINGKAIKIQNWIGSQNHNWGSKHTDHYAWGQVAGFPGSPDTFLELATA